MQYCSTPLLHGHLLASYLTLDLKRGKKLALLGRQIASVFFGKKFPPQFIRRNFPTHLLQRFANVRYSFFCAKISFADFSNELSPTASGSVNIIVTVFPHHPNVTRLDTQLVSQYFPGTFFQSIGYIVKLRTFKS